MGHSILEDVEVRTMAIHPNDDRCVNGSRDFPSLWVRKLPDVPLCEAMRCGRELWRRCNRGIHILRIYTGEGGAKQTVEHINIILNDIVNGCKEACVLRTKY